MNKYILTTGIFILLASSIFSQPRYFPNNQFYSFFLEMTFFDHYPDPLKSSMFSNSKTKQKEWSENIAVEHLNSLNPILNLFAKTNVKLNILLVSDNEDLLDINIMLIKKNDIINNSIIKENKNYGQVPRNLLTAKQFLILVFFFLKYPNFRKNEIV